MFEFPRNPIKEDEWTIDPKFLAKIADGFFSVNEDFNPSMEGIECVLLALERMFEFPIHDSDCATHNMPAMPNGKCDCSFAELQRYVDTDRQKTNEINILTKENCKLSRVELMRHDAYCGAMEEMGIWKKRALEAEDSNRKLADYINEESAPSFMGEPVLRKSAQAAVPEWQPIETAPKDGTSILIWKKSNSFYVAEYDDTFSFPWRILNDEGLSEKTPTYWTPLPSTPDSEKGGS